LANPGCKVTLESVLLGNATLDKFQSFFQSYIWNDYIRLLDNVTCDSFHPLYNNPEMLSRRLFLYMKGILPMPPFKLDASTIDGSESRALEVLDMVPECHLDLSQE
jgi:hypothetical protein